jgi:hypothetical protein
LQERELLEKLLETERLKAVADFSWLKKMATATGPWEDGTYEMRPIGGTRGDSFKRAFWSRAAGAGVGAAFLIGPMWPLVLKQDIYLQLGITTGCIIAFGSVMVFALDKLEAVFAATLGYAAVLVVFVGVVMQNLGGR